MTGWRFAYSMFIRSVNYNRTMEKHKGRFILIATKPYSRFAWMKNSKQFGSWENRKD